MGKLAGLKVVDLTQYLPGPMMTMMLADQGATVIKVETPSGDPARDQAPFENGQSVWFRNVNRGKTSLALDLKTDDGRDRLWQLLQDADVFVEGFRPGVIDRLGFGYDAVAARYPRIVYCSLTAFGQEGKRAHHPAHDLVVQALCGFLSVNDGGYGKPLVPGVPSADMAAGLTALSAVLIGLLGRAASGRGDFCDIAMFDSLLPWCVHIAGEAIAGGEAPRSSAQRSLGGAAFYQVYETADHRHVVLGGREPKFVATLLSALGRPDLIEHGQAPAGQQGELIDFLKRTFATRSRDQWVEWFGAKDVAFAPVLDFREALSSVELEERGLLVEFDGAHQIAPAIRFQGESWTPRAAPEPDRA